MKIALVSFGHVDVVLPLVKNLKNRNVFVELFFCFAFDRKSESILDFTDKKISIGFLTNEKINEILNEGIKRYLSDISFINIFIFHNQKLRSIKNFLISLSLIKKLKTYDIIHFNGTNGVLPLIIFLLRGKKLIFTLHDIYSHSGEKTKYNFGEKLNEYIVKSNYPLIVQNINDYAYLINKYPRIAFKFNFIPFGVLDVYKEFKTIKKEPKSDLLFFGRISPYKGIEYLLDSIRELFNNGIILKTIIAGSGDIYFKNGDLEKIGVKLINRYIPNEELVALIEGTKIIICPYTDATQSGAVMTAFAFNKPVIASDVGSFPEVIKDGITGFLVKPKDTGELASKISILLSSPELLNNMSDNINRMTTSGEYSWNRITEKLANLYNSVLQ